MLKHRAHNVRIGRSKALGSFGTRIPPTTAIALQSPLNATAEASAELMCLWLTISPNQAGLPLHTLVSEITSRLKPKARTDASNRRIQIITTIIANFLWLPSIAVNLKRDKATRYQRQGIKGEPLSQALMELEELGLISIQPFQFKRLRTIIAPTPKLEELIAKHQVTTACTVRLQDEEVIILKRPKKSRSTANESAAESDDQAQNQVDSNDGGDEIDYPDDCAAANTLRTPLRQYNQFLSQSSIHIIGTPDAPPFAPFKRIFRFNGTISFNLRGRLHRGQVGGWNQNLPKEQRHLIRINGEPVCDLDYSNMHIRLGYLEAKCPPPDGDLYDIGHGLENYRSAVKQVVVAMLAKTGPTTKLPKGTRNQLPKQWNGKNIAQAVMEYHAPIAHIFGKANSHRFTFLESQVLLEVLCRLMNEHDVPALPMHDGLMVQASKRELAMKVMQQVALDVLGVVLPVEATIY
jgi:hypothetical protein